jgi:hypothetical protein
MGGKELLFLCAVGNMETAMELLLRQFLCLQNVLLHLKLILFLRQK